MNTKIFNSFKFFLAYFLLFFLSCTSSFAIKEDFKCDVNCCFSIGQTCRTAYHIQRLGKRFQASPLDWMRDYSLDTCIHFLKTKFSDFFEEIKELPLWPGEYRGRTIKDTKNGVISIHHFMQGQPIKEEHQKFRKTMLNRANKLDEILKKSESIALVYSQECANTPFPDDQKLIEFLKSFSEIYPGKKIYLILTKIENIKDVQNKIVFEENNLKIIKFTFWDYGENWTGNHSAWDKVIGSINLV